MDDDDPTAGRPCGDDPAIAGQGVKLMRVRIEPACRVAADLRAYLPGLPSDTCSWGLILYSEHFPVTMPGQEIPVWPTVLVPDLSEDLKLTDPPATAGRPCQQFAILDTDEPFPDSPPAGALLCFCSRCREWIDEGLQVVRCPAADGRPWEYRYCPVCAELAS